MTTRLEYYRHSKYREVQAGMFRVPPRGQLCDIFIGLRRIQQHTTSV